MQFDLLIDLQRANPEGKFVHADNKNFKAVIIRIDSGGGDALASDL